MISNDSLDETTTQTIPKFKFEGEVASINANFMEPFDGYIIKRHSEL
jgi:hypothetical protein